MATETPDQQLERGGDLDPLRPPIIDAHIHPFETADIHAEMELLKRGEHTIDDVLADLDARLERRGVERAIVFMLDPDALPTLNAIPERLVVSMMVDFRRHDWHAVVDRAAAKGVRGIKILTYEQEVTTADYDEIIGMSHAVESNDMFLTVCSTFGSIKLYDHDAIACVSAILKNGYRAPLIMAHGGGSRAREALLIMDDAPNVYLDTSFTTTYWKGSGVIDELAYTIRRFPERCFFGTDAPYVEWHQAVDDAGELLDKLSRDVQRKLIYDNAARFLEEYGQS